MLKITPPPTKTYPCWIAAYGGHYDVIVVSLEDPKDEPHEIWDDALRVPKSAFTMGFSDFELWWGVERSTDRTRSSNTARVLSRYRSQEVGENGNRIAFRPHPQFEDYAIGCFPDLRMEN